MKELPAGAKDLNEAKKEKGPTGSGDYTSEELFRGTREIIIEHSGQHYRLRITKAGKLILNK